MLELLTWENLAALVTLTAIEIALGIDNIVFLSIVTGRLPVEQRPLAQRLGLIGALVMRLLLLFSITWIMQLKKPFVHFGDHGFSGKDAILLVGGLFLIWKGTKEIHHKLEDSHADGGSRAPTTFASAVAMIALVDLVFSLDSVITAVGMAQSLVVMVVAVILSIGVMLRFAGPISRMIERHPTLKVLALSFVILIGVFLVAEGMGQHIEKGYIYFAMAFSLVVEIVNLRVATKQAPRKG